MQCKAGHSGVQAEVFVDHGELFGGHCVANLEIRQLSLACVQLIALARPIQGIRRREGSILAAFCIFMMLRGRVVGLAAVPLQPVPSVFGFVRSLGFPVQAVGM
ncbi:hypothetical protein GGTG_08659 [Gaeumannomyces tritici R3-111a-1]|uniref:Uncharacterized protein n=1 Tax=Gaeumannomyces tritici (strain R3-111a-1) TaxID=644352 RepID=J3P570_GAET3|nr:hypothetical protein GGTG_08659 [Gaeumannomyces tritici R3-111a-1]EJT74821.1 hypothetical protein GGTG_08659 [Gaeumannomyces tritici R3-111a-1]